ncbi:hypothetical protein AB0C18_22100 [Nonomuraea muscovyensis]|uniref:hypothetical protein n=1 Tax=Nonomuraea muscovyensis TaxID=1124761 RepID=UPI0033E0118D
MHARDRLPSAGDEPGRAGAGVDQVDVRTSRALRQGPQPPAVAQGDRVQQGAARGGAVEGVRMGWQVADVHITGECSVMTFAKGGDPFPKIRFGRA